MPPTVVACLQFGIGNRHTCRPKRSVLNVKPTVSGDNAYAYLMRTTAGSFGAVRRYFTAECPMANVVTAF